jgi:transposase InsO family protein
MARKVGQIAGRGRHTLRGPAKWTYFYLYVILHVFSRYVTGWMIAYRERADVAKEFH